ncbi:DUF6922 domain-containing protein [Flavobacterium columnare]|uniref:DUF6922 domain-containing protein n=1 Tax=Flavobacterium columnare (strain ATCC 49512 / CIP 103533 / TG 44/87) TaxID=1041826 RepID=G8X9S3_FLACA|nr:hypothetical protein [Flavobacterium columnare]AEW87271.1 hypothetical protein FCOL_12360 [Flavobacterium columnare ATCC 49512]AUX17015.1 hypothetical protein AQ623_00835 [Flavobacterium columnare]MBF6657389.1 hypothetical protein [Flavobacterium columnare]PTD16296.1 hypothetical protein C6N29_01370 [Flavobacterium columnare]QOG58744.1 hypothetical protein HUE30_00810 [Flavobacterium columnare]
MKKTVNILEKIPNYVFWDLDVTKLNIHKDSDVIISRILMFSDFSNYSDNILFLESLYTEETIKRVIIASTERISDEICSLTSKRYNTPIKSKFNKYVYL